MMQISRQGIQAYHSEKLVYDLGKFIVNKVNFACFFTVILGLEVSTFRRIILLTLISVSKPFQKGCDFTVFSAIHFYNCLVLMGEGLIHLTRAYGFMGGCTTPLLTR